MSTKKKIFWFLGAIGAGIGVAWWVKKRSTEVPGLADWQKSLIEKYGFDKGKTLSDRIRGEYPLLLCQQAMPENTILRWHLTKNILPGLTLYRVLLEENGGDQPAALAEVDRIFRARVKHRTGKILPALEKLPDPFMFLLRAFDGIMKVYPDEGWDFQFIEKSSERIAFNCTRCFYLNTLTALGAPELTSSFCKMDDVMAEAFPRQIRFERLYTLGRGNDVCDFQYIHHR